MPKNSEKIKVKLADKTFIEIPLYEVTFKSNKYFLNKDVCRKYNIPGEDVLLKKVSKDIFKPITDRKKERKIFKEEDNFFVDMYDKKLSSCFLCEEDIYGKNLKTVNRLKRFLWEIYYKCPSCQFEGVEVIDLRDIE
ncbi:MAG: hypothetical protein ACOCV8_00610 [Spirochaetota bacterium]